MDYYICHQIRCKTCLQQTGYDGERFYQLLGTGMTPEMALDSLGRDMPCCRQTIMSPTKYPFRADVPEVMFGLIPVENYQPGMTVSTITTSAALPGTDNFPSLALTPLAPLVPVPSLPSLATVEAGPPIPIDPDQPIFQPFEGAWDEPTIAGVPTFNPLVGQSRIEVVVDPLARFRPHAPGVVDKKSLDKSVKLTGATYINN